MAKKLLLICPKFFGYEKFIKKEFQRKGFSVYYINETPRNISRKLFKLKRYKDFSVFIKNNENRVLRKIPKIGFDFLIVIKSEFLSSNFYKELYKRTKITTKILYEWDSLKYIDYTNIVQCFDKCFTFDRVDAEQLDISYLPLFYVDENVNMNTLPKTDLFYCGSMNANRQPLLMKMKSLCKQRNLIFFCYLYTPLLVFFKKLLKKEIRISDGIYHIHKLSHKSFYKRALSSKYVLDINTLNQNGLTMRTFEVLSLNRILITCNNNIVNEKKILPEMYRIIDFDKLDCFEFPEYSASNFRELMTDFSLESWCSNLLK